MKKLSHTQEEVSTPNKQDFKWQMENILFEADVDIALLSNWGVTSFVQHKFKCYYESLKFTDYCLDIIKKWKTCNVGSYLINLGSATIIKLIF